ncbi:MAG: ribonuclease III [Gemmatimonadota bacterium]
MGWIGSLIRRLRGRAIPEDLPRSVLLDLERRLAYRFTAPWLLVQALKHRSYVYSRQGTGVESNERLEYLGDAVLDLVVADFLFHRFADRREGDLTQMKSLVVSRAVLARQARALDLGSFVLLSPEERSAGGGQQPSILSDALEAVIGAIYLDGGLEPARRVIHGALLHDFDELSQGDDYTNYKSLLLEHTQSLGSGHPKYHVQDEQGPDHEKTFSVEVSITGETLGTGHGRSKKEAQQMAARDALQRLGHLP